MWTANSHETWNIKNVPNEIIRDGNARMTELKSLEWKRERMLATRIDHVHVIIFCTSVIVSRSKIATLYRIPCMTHAQHIWSLDSIKRKLETYCVRCVYQIFNCRGWSGRQYSWLTRCPNSVECLCVNVWIIPWKKEKNNKQTDKQTHETFQSTKLYILPLFHVSECQLLQ